MSSSEASPKLESPEAEAEAELLETELPEAELSEVEAETELPVAFSSILECVGGHSEKSLL